MHGGQLIDPFDPTLWRVDDYEHRIYLDNYEHRFAIVDAIDYPWAAQWCWSPKTSRGPNAKLYAVRATKLYSKLYIKNVSIYLHVAIMERTKIACPGERSLYVVDHRNGDSLDCRRSNLRWATRSQNQRNINGRCAFDLFEPR